MQQTFLTAITSWIVIFLMECTNIFCTFVGFTTFYVSLFFFVLLACNGSPINTRTCSVMETIRNIMCKSHLLMQTDYKKISETISNSSSMHFSPASMFLWLLSTACKNLIIAVICISHLASALHNDGCWKCLTLFRAPDTFFLFLSPSLSLSLSLWLWIKNHSAIRMLGSGQFQNVESNGKSSVCAWVEL